MDTVPEEATQFENRVSIKYGFEKEGSAGVHFTMSKEIRVIKLQFNVIFAWQPTGYRSVNAVPNGNNRYLKFLQI